jgi:hypothetical protein
MRRQQRQLFPQIFTWRGQEYQVEAVERCWTVTHRGRENQVEGYRFRVRARRQADGPSQESIFELFQDAQTGDWHVQRCAVGED